MCHLRFELVVLLADVVLETLRIIIEHPVWEGIVRKAYETSKVDAPLQQLTQELADAETAGILSNSHVIPIKQVYTDWLVSCFMLLTTTHACQHTRLENKCTSMRKCQLVTI